MCLSDTFSICINTCCWVLEACTGWLYASYCIDSCKAEVCAGCQPLFQLVNVNLCC